LLSAILAYHPLIFLWLVGYDLKHRWFGPPQELAALDDWTVWQALVVIGFLLAAAAIPALVANLALARRARVRPRWLWLAATAMAVLPAVLIGSVFSDVGNAINYWVFH
jgi:hypothetical protein